jgi:uncharacterized OB-fold protein
MLIVPKPDSLTQPYWDGAHRRQLLIQRCHACHQAIHPPLPMCPRCRAEQLDWVAASGKGIVYSKTVVHHAAHTAMVDKVPYLVVLVTLEEGPRVVSSMRGIAFEDVAIGMPVRVLFEALTPDLTLPLFELDTTRWQGASQAAHDRAAARDGDEDKKRESQGHKRGHNEGHKNEDNKKEDNKGDAA